MWYWSAEGKFWTPQFSPPFYPCPSIWSFLSFPPGFFTGPAFQGFWHYLWFYQIIFLVFIFYLQFYITGHNCQNVLSIEQQTRRITHCISLSWPDNQYPPSRDAYNWWLIIKTELTQMWKELGEYQSGYQYQTEYVFKQMWLAGESSWSLEVLYMGLQWLPKISLFFFYLLNQKTVVLIEKLESRIM